MMKVQFCGKRPIAANDIEDSLRRAISRFDILWISPGRDRFRYFDETWSLQTRYLKPDHYGQLWHWADSCRSIYSMDVIGTPTGELNRVIAKTLNHLPDNSSIDDFLEQVKESMRIGYSPYGTGVERHCSFKRAQLQRETGNENKNTFDFVKVDVVIMGVQNVIEYFKSHMSEIVRLCYIQIERNGKIARSGFPVNALRLSDAVLLDPKTIQMIFELKRELLELQESS